MRKLAPDTAGSASPLRPNKTWLGDAPQTSIHAFGAPRRTRRPLRALVTTHVGERLRASSRNEIAVVAEGLLWPNAITKQHLPTTMDYPVRNQSEGKHLCRLLAQGSSLRHDHALRKCFRHREKIESRRATGIGAPKQCRGTSEWNFRWIQGRAKAKICANVFEALARTASNALRHLEACKPVRHSIMQRN